MLFSRVKETSTTVGTGTYTLLGAPTGFRSFATAAGSGNYIFYFATDGVNWEDGYGVVTAGSPDTLGRTVLESSNSNAAVNWSGATITLFCAKPGPKEVFIDRNGNVGLGTALPIDLLHLYNNGVSAFPAVRVESGPSAGWPRMVMKGGAGGTDSKTWDFLLTATTLLGRAVNDIESSGANWLTVTRSGAAISAINFGAACTAVSFTNTSAREAKDNIADFAPADGALALIESVHVVGFTYKADPGVPRVGFIADDTDPVLSGPNRDSMDLGSAIGVLIKALQEETAARRALEARVAALEGR